MSRILVAEDDPHILRVISLWLSRLGHEVIEARNGLAALELFRERRPEIIITDINMPGIDGVELLQRVADEPDGPIGIVVLTNRWDHREIADRLPDERVYVVPKPFSPTSLADRIRKLTELAAQGPVA